MGCFDVRENSLLVKQGEIVILMAVENRCQDTGIAVERGIVPICVYDVFPGDAEPSLCVERRLRGSVLFAVWEENLWAKEQGEIQVFWIQG